MNNSKGRKLNERIRELAEQAGYKHPDAVGTCEDYAYFDHEKFALLIVQECMDRSTWVGKMNTTPIEPIHTAHAINKRIRQHFGVEE